MTIERGSSWRDFTRTCKSLEFLVRILVIFMSRFAKISPKLLKFFLLYSNTCMFNLFQVSLILVFSAIVFGIRNLQTTPETEEGFHDVIVIVTQYLTLTSRSASAELVDIFTSIGLKLGALFNGYLTLVLILFLVKLIAKDFPSAGVSATLG